MQTDFAHLAFHPCTPCRVSTQLWVATPSSDFDMHTAAQITTATTRRRLVGRVTERNRLFNRNWRMSPTSTEQTLQHRIGFQFDFAGRNSTGSMQHRVHTDTPASDINNASVCANRFDVEPIGQAGSLVELLNRSLHEFMLIRDGLKLSAINGMRLHRTACETVSPHRALAKTVTARTNVSPASAQRQAFAVHSSPQHG